MKKTLSLLCAAFALAFSVNAEKVKVDLDYDVPELDKAGAFVIDAKEFKGRKIEAVRVVNYSDNANIAYDAYVHSPISQKWEFLGSAVLKAFGDRALVGREYENLSAFRYIAIVPQKDGDFDFFVEKNRQGFFQKAILTVEVRSPEYILEDDPRPKHPDPNAYVCSEGEIPKGVKKDILIENRTDKREISVKVFGYSKDSLRWIPLGTVNTKVTEAQSVLKMKKSKIDDYYYFAFLGPSEIACSLSEEKGNLIAVVRDK